MGKSSNNRTMANDSGAGTSGTSAPLSNAAPQSIGPMSAGVAATVSRSDHQHPWLHVANQAALDALSASTMVDGQRVWVDTYKDSFTLTASTQAVAANVRRTALGKAGYLWIRDGFSPSWWNQTAWAVNVTTGSDEAVGSVAAPLATFAEFRRRMFERWLPGTETQNVTVALQTDLADSDYVSSWQAMPRRNASNQLIINGTQTVQAGGTGVVSGAIAINRAAGQRNTVTVAGVNFAPFVGMLLRLQGTTTTTAVIMRDLGANTCELSEQSVNGVTGAGFTNGQTIEVIKGTKVGGANLGLSNNFSTFTDCDFDPAASAQIVSEPSSNASISLTRCRVRGTGTFQVIASSLTLTACAFSDRAGSIVGRASLNICAQVNQPGTGLTLINSTNNENSSISHTSEASTLTFSNNTYYHVGGGGSASIGFFNLGAGQIGINVPQGSLFSCGGMWGSGNNATSIPVNLQQGAGWVVPSFAVIATVMTIAGGVGMSVATQSALMNIPMVQLPHAIGPGIQPITFAKFSGVSGDAGAPTTTFFADTSILPGAGIGVPLQYPTSEKCVVRLRLGAVTGTGANPPTATLFKNGVATAMTCTLGAGAAAGANVVDSAHPILFVDGDRFDVQITQPVAAEGDAVFTATLEALA